jgi:hypothetical protein
MTIAAKTIADRAIDASSVVATTDGTLTSRVIDLMLISILSALFWALLLNGALAMVGFTISATALCLFTGAIAIFLAVVCAPLMLRA